MFVWQCGNYGLILISYFCRIYLPDYRNITFYCISITMGQYYNYHDDAYAVPGQYKSDNIVLT